MTPEKIKEKIEKREAELKELRKQAKDAELAEQKAQEQAAKLEALSPQITDAIQALLNKAKISLPTCKSIITIMGDSGLTTTILNEKPKVNHIGDRGRKSIMFEGKQISWSQLCTLKNINRLEGGSAHRDVYNKARELHDSIEHVCIIDDVKYPVKETK
jgi:hypothetical protein